MYIRILYIAERLSGLRRELLAPAKVLSIQVYIPDFTLEESGQNQGRSWCAAKRISRIFFPAAATLVPGPKMATAPAS